MSDKSIARMAGERDRFNDLSVVVPAFNESEGIGLALESLLSGVPGAEIIVVDDGSTDDTAEVVQRFPGVTLVRHPFNRGYGGALKTGMAAATRELVGWFDADNEHRVADLVTMVERIRREPVAAIIGQRGETNSALRGFGKAVILVAAWTLGFRGSRDMNCGLRVFRTEVILRYLPLLPNGYSASITSLMVMLERRYPIGYSSVKLGKRAGQSKVTLRAGFAALLLVFRVIMLFAPIRIFGPVAGVLLLVGVLYSGIVLLVVGTGLPVFGAFLMLSGILVGMLGLIADQLSQMRLAQYETAALHGQTRGRADGMDDLK